MHLASVSTVLLQFHSSLQHIFGKLVLMCSANHYAAQYFVKMKLVLLVAEQYDSTVRAV
jgi:hypothetical protein